MLSFTLSKDNKNIRSFRILIDFKSRSFNISYNL